jgi:hypothetical protein
MRDYSLPFDPVSPLSYSYSAQRDGYSLTCAFAMCFHGMAAFAPLFLVIKVGAIYVELRRHVLIELL